MDRTSNGKSLNGQLPGDQVRAISALFISLSLFTSSLVCADQAGYITPTSGTASTTQFDIGPEFAGGTSCGATAFPKGLRTNGAPGGGPGFLYAAVNQLHFGANPAVPGAGGPGYACGLCFRLTPLDPRGNQLVANALTFMIVDECPVLAGGNSGNRSPSCGMCHPGDVNGNGQQTHFDIAVDAMNQAQHNHFFNGCPNGNNWPAVHYTETSCDGGVHADPVLHPWGCMQGCKNNMKASVCQNIL
ncbi:MAG: hypothetical protein FRX48_00072 [Lasallia pustulata]|uniref:Uncharacterized protein n=1 Tax=Lasallia pustulata TaxID=136370 RepID=A0A5M8Q1T2_9LECA|nr:MAG: hypothetical protein FRX48_00072 [Lasallia pustulata]